MLSRARCVTELGKHEKDNRFSNWAFSYRPLRHANPVEKSWFAKVCKLFYGLLSLGILKFRKKQGGKMNEI